MSFTRKLAFASLATALALPLHSANDDKDKTNEVPRITLAVPFAVAAGATNQIVIRGLSLTNATDIQFTPAVRGAWAEIKSRGKAAIPDKGDAKKAGDTQIEVDIVLSEDIAPGDLPFMVRTPDGDTNTNLLHVVMKKRLFREKEPNDGFRKPNDIALPQTVSAVIGDVGDVDVFKFQGRAGQRISAETRSTTYGSTLDSIVTLHDRKGHVIATSDDISGTDARLEQLLPYAGDYFLSVNDAHDRGGVTYGYLLEVREAPP